MFVPRHFAIEDNNEIDDFIEKNDFGILISQVDDLPFATHIPFHRSQKDLLQAHLAKANPQWQQLDGQKVLVVLPGNHDYISPTWYANPGVPTWNYQTVHISGTAKCFTDSDRLLKLVKTLSETYERSREPMWDGEFENSMLNAIVGIDIHIESLQCKYKLSQNRPVEDRENVIQKLQEAGNVDLATEMQRILDKKNQ